MIVRAFLFSFKAGCRFVFSTCYFAYVNSLSAEKHDCGFAKFSNFDLETVFLVRDCNISLGSTR